MKPVKESALQNAVIAYITGLPHVASGLVFAIANQLDQRDSLGAVRKRAKMGVRAGVPDVLLALGRKGHYGLFLELKRDGGKVGEAQMAFHNRLRSAGYRVEVVWDFETAVRVVNEYLGIE